jgi:hypothetical protein
MLEYVFQAIRANPDGSIHTVCHEGKFEAFDLEAAIVTAQALLEVIPISEACNALYILDQSRHILWTGDIEETA